MLTAGVEVNAFKITQKKKQNINSKNYNNIHL